MRLPVVSLKVGYGWTGTFGFTCRSDRPRCCLGRGMLGAHLGGRGQSAVMGLRRRGMDRWIGSYVRQVGTRRAGVAFAQKGGKPVHLLLCIGDHFEPRNGGVGPEQARARLQNWVTEYPRLYT